MELIIIVLLLVVIGATWYVYFRNQPSIIDGVDSKNTPNMAPYKIEAPDLTVITVDNPKPDNLTEENSEKVVTSTTKAKKSTKSTKTTKTAVEKPRPVATRKPRKPKMSIAK